MAQKKFNTRLEDKIDQVRGGIYACAKANCKQCPFNGHGQKDGFCMDYMLKTFNSLINDIRSK